jgi:vanillate O-demethylase ferredoxin subunit
MAMEQLDPQGRYPKSRLELRVRQITFQAAGISSYELVDPSGGELPPFTAGAHVDFYLRDGRVRQYSLCNDPAERHRYVIAVQREERGRGGSMALHDRVHVQRLVSIGTPRNNFALDPRARRHLLLAGGIGVTPMKAMLHQLARDGADCTLHYCCRSAQHAAFGEELAPFVASGRAVLHHDGGDPAKGLDLAALLREQAQGTHLYYCGPEGFNRACRDASAHWRPDTVHFESFAAGVLPQPATAAGAGDTHSHAPVFKVRVASTGATFDVPDNRTIVDVLRDNGVEIETSCNAGLCATCKTGYLEGEVDHRDYILDDADHPRYFTPCVSRANSPLLVIDL